VAWIVRLVKTGADGEKQCADVLKFNRPDDLGDIANLGLTLAEGKLLLAGLQQEIVAAQAKGHAVRRPDCRSCGEVCRVKDYRNHAVATLFGQVTVRLPRFRCAGCGGNEAGHGWPSHCRSTPELDRLQAHLCALMTYRVAAAVLEQMFPVGAGNDPETLRSHTLKIGADLRDQPAVRPDTAAAPIEVTLDSTFIRSCEDVERHLEVRVGNVETEFGGRQVFGAVAKADTDIKVLINRSLDAVGRTEDTVLTAFTDGCSGLRRILADAGVTEAPMLDWFHIAMRLQHLEQTAGGLSGDDPARVDRRGSRTSALAAVERQSQGRANQHRSHPRGDASFSGGTRAAEVHRAFEKAVDRLARAGWLSHRTEPLVGQLRRAAPCRTAGRDCDHRRHGQFSGEPSDEQIAADALVAARGGSSASGSLRRL
jgi:hypothetical protein